MPDVEQKAETPMPPFPAPLAEFLARHVRVSNLSRAEQFKRLHAFELHRLRKRCPGATASDAARLIYRLQKDGIPDEKHWIEFANDYAPWWSQERAAIIRRNAALLKKKPLDQPNGEAG